MARLNYTVTYKHIVSPVVPGEVKLTVLSNYSGTAQARIYRQGDVPPAFSNMSVSGTDRVFTLPIPVLSGRYIIEYKDLKGERLIAWAEIADSPRCTDIVSGGFSVFDSRIVLFIDNVGLGSDILYSMNGFSWRAAATSGPSFAEWTSSEISLAGFTTSIPTFRHRRISTVDAVAVTFSAPSNPAYNPSLFTQANMISSAGYIVGQTVYFTPSSPYATGNVVEVGPTHVVFQHSYVPTTGATMYRRTECDYTFAQNVNIAQLLEALTATFTKTDVTSNGGTDGSITVTAAGGSGSYTYLWDDGPTTANRSGLLAGLYSVTITDTNTLETVELDISITEPAIVLPSGSFLFVPLMNPFRMVQRITPNNCETFQTPDNTLFCEEVHPYFTKSFYAQKVMQCDIRTQQWNSDYSIHYVDLFDYITDELVKSFVPELKESNIGQAEQYPVIIKNHGAGQSRVYFGTGLIPIPLAIGDPFEIINNIDGFNGAYSVVSIQSDVSVGAQYIVINKNFDIVAASSSATGVFTTNVVDFDVFESVLSFADVPAGMYYLKITAWASESNLQEWISEPMDVAAAHPDTNLLEFRCIDNAFDMTWTTGITCAVRVESVFQQRFVGGMRAISRNNDHSIVKTAAKKTRIMRLDTFQLPPYLHEKLAVGFDCDVIRVNGIEVQTDSDYDKPKYTTRFQLANSGVDVEQVGWFDKQNLHDIGNVDGETGFIIVNGGYLKR